MTSAVNQQEELDRLRFWGSPEICHYLAMKVRRHRLDAGISQAEFAKRAGIPLRTYKRFESHGKANLETFIEVLRAMGRTHYLAVLFAAPPRNVTSTTAGTPTFVKEIRSVRGAKGDMSMAKTKLAAPGEFRPLVEVADEAMKRLVPRRT